MNLYQLETTDDEGIGLLSAEDRRYLRWNLTGRPLAGEWPEIRVTVITSDELTEHRPPSDFPAIDSGVLVVRPAARDVIEPFLAGNAEVLPLVCDDAELWLINVTRLVEGALDVERSDLLLSPEGEIWLIRGFAFHEEVVGSIPMFKLPEQPRLPIVFNDAFVDCVTASGLRGVAFRRIWSSADTPVSP